jgi:hypothetical protein
MVSGIVSMANIKKIFQAATVVVSLVLVLHSSVRAEQPSSAKGSPVIEVSIKDVVSNPGEYNGKKVSLEGKVTKVDYRNSSKGEQFAVFKLKDSENNEVGVYYKDNGLPISKGDKVKIMGRFWKEKSYFLFKIKNVIRARTVDILRVPQ